MRILSILRRAYFTLLGPINHFNLFLNHVKHGKCEINGILFLQNEGKFIIGNGVTINSSKFANTIGGDTRAVFIVRNNAVLDIGDNTGISNSAIYCSNNIAIGRNVLIGGGCKIWDFDFHPIDPNLRLTDRNRNPKTAPIIIHDNVFIGSSCIILKGVEIGENSVVGAGSVVTKIIPSNQIWAGNPAHFIKNIETKP